METPQYELFHEDIYKALGTCVQALGGSQKVGCMLWGESALPEDQGRKLDHCLGDHAQKLALKEMLLILRKAHDVGCHAGINFITSYAGYSDPQPVNLEDEIAELQKTIIEAVKTHSQNLDRMERLLTLNTKPRSVA